MGKRFEWHLLIRTLLMPFFAVIGCVYLLQWGLSEARWPPFAIVLVVVCLGIFVTRGVVVLLVFFRPDYFRSEPEPKPEQSPGVKWRRQITTRELPAETLWAEFRELLAYFKAQGHPEVSIVFGFAWGNDVYDKDWLPIRLPVEQVEGRVKAEEDNLIGRIGEDDLFLEIPDMPVEFKFCHESDLHLRFGERVPIVTAILERWRGKGFEPKERER